MMFQTSEASGWSLGELGFPYILDLATCQLCYWSWEY